MFQEKFSGNLTTMSQGIKELYFELAGEAPSCTLSGPERPYTEEEEVFIGKQEITENPAILFTDSGKFHFIGFKGNWHRIISYTHHDFDRVLCNEALRRLGFIENIGQNKRGERMARIVV